MEEENRRFPPVQIFVLLGIILVLSALIVPTVVREVGKRVERVKPADKETTKTPLLIGKFLPFIPKTFKISLEFDIETRKIALLEFGIIGEEIVSDERLAAGSGYEIVLFDEKEQRILSSRVVIHENLFYDPPLGQDPSSYLDQLPKKISSVIYLPYDDRARKIAIFKNKQKIFELPVTTGGANASGRNSNFSEIAQACEKIVVAVVSDGYTDMAEFRSHANQVTSGSSQDPYTSGLFDFRTYENTTPIGCSQNILGCFNTPALTSVLQKAKTDTGSKIEIVLARGGGISAALFGGPAVINSTGSIAWLTKHEFLGHAVGKLYDRYVIGIGLEQEIRSNCTDNPNGEAFWKEAGGATFQGCTTASLYAPFENTCSGGGNPKTVMANCNSSGQFDAVEKLWIKNNIIPALNCQAPPNVTGPPPTSIVPTGGGGGGTSPTPIGGTCTGPNQKLCGGTCFSVSTCSTEWVCVQGIPACNPGPTQPANLSTTISWGAMSSAAGGYEIVWVGGSTNTGVVRTGDTSYTFNNLTPGSYSWKIWALDADGNRTSDNTGIGKIVK